MNNSLTVIMYHYVRNKTICGKLNALSINNFKEQIDYINSNYNIIDYNLLLECMNGKRLPERSAILTFDDGYIDHYINVLPILMDKKISGIFAVPGEIIRNKKIMDVNKIQLLLANSKVEEIMEGIYKQLNYYRGVEFEIPSNKELYNKLAKESRLDNKNVIFVKRLLQNELDKRLRKLIIDNLFKKMVNLDEDIIFDQLYMNYSQISVMDKVGMTIALHGYEHSWLGKLPENEMVEDVDKSIEIMSEFLHDNWPICFPYGSYNDDTINYLMKLGCKAGFTTFVKKINTIDYKKDFWLIDRMDTNDYPPISNNYLNIQ